MKRSIAPAYFIVVSLFCSYANAQAALDDVEIESKVSGERPPATAIKRETWKLKRGAKEWGAQTGFAPMQPTFFSGNKEYDTDGRRFSLIGFRYGRVIGTVGGVTYEYLFEASPYAVAINNEVAYDGPDTKYKTVRSDTVGVTVQPAGFRFIFRPEKRVKPFVQTAAGFIFTRRPMPVPESTNYNFVGDFGGGLMYSITRQHIVKGGYRYYHISNMNIGEMNPGYNANMFYVDLTLFSR